MADSWYFVQKGNRQGPVAIEVIEAMLSQLELGPEDYVWKKGFENWKKIKDVVELQKTPEELIVPQAPEPIEEEVFISRIDANQACLYIRVGIDRGAEAVDYGPYTLKQLRQFYKENRINGKTFVLMTGMKDFKILADLPDYLELFQENPPVIKDTDRRSSKRRPFVARLFVQNNKQVNEGICRDISIGGMQILMADFKGKTGDQISINAHPENTDYHFTASGVVVRVLEGNAGFSFRFDRLSDEAKNAIEKYIKQN
jgi:hypothetical protein